MRPALAPAQISLKLYSIACRAALSAASSSSPECRSATFRMTAARSIAHWSKWRAMIAPATLPRAWGVLDVPRRRPRDAIAGVQNRGTARSEPAHAVLTAVDWPNLFRHPVALGGDASARARGSFGEQARRQEIGPRHGHQVGQICERTLGKVVRRGLAESRRTCSRTIRTRSWTASERPSSGILSTSPRRISAPQSCCSRSSGRLVETPKSPGTPSTTQQVAAEGEPSSLRSLAPRISIGHFIRLFQVAAKDPRFLAKSEKRWGHVKED